MIAAYGFGLRPSSQSFKIGWLARDTLRRMMQQMPAYYWRMPDMHERFSKLITIGRSHIITKRRYWQGVNTINYAIWILQRGHHQLQQYYLAYDTVSLTNSVSSIRSKLQRNLVLVAKLMSHLVICCCLILYSVECLVDTKSPLTVHTSQKRVYI